MGVVRRRGRGEEKFVGWRAEEVGEVAPEGEIVGDFAPAEVYALLGEGEPDEGG